MTCKYLLLFFLLLNNPGAQKNIEQNVKWMKYLYTLLKLNAKCCRSRGLLGICLLSIQDRHLGATCCLHLLPVKFKCLSVCVYEHVCMMCEHTCAQCDLSREQGPGGQIQSLNRNEDLKDTLQPRLQITAFSRWATGLQSSLFHWSEQLSVCIKYSKKGPCILSRWLLQPSFLTPLFSFSVAVNLSPSFTTLLYIQNNDWNFETHRKTLETVDHGELCVISHCCFLVL